MSFAAVIGAFATGTYTVTRRGAGTYDAAGLFVAASSSTLSVSGVLQPIAGRVLDSGEAGQRGKDTRLFHTTTLLRTRDANGAADVLTVDGEDWTVIESSPWVHPIGGSFYRVRLERGAAT